MSQLPCLKTQCPHFIPPQKAGFAGPDGQPGIMRRNGRCALSGRIISRMTDCPKPALINPGDRP
jgi:hypothetical protein